VGKNRPVNAIRDTTSPWSRHALVLIDLQRDFWSAEAASTSPELPDRVAQLLEHARAEGLAVVHVRARFEPDGRDWMARYRLRGWIPCVRGTSGAETLPFAVELPGEPVVTKQTFDGFLCTDLDEVLAERGIRSLLIAGLVTSTCVLFTASTATQRGSLVSVVADCCSDRAEAHWATLDSYPFIFETVRSEQISQRRAAWNADLDRLESPPRANVRERRTADLQLPARHHRSRHLGH
jgi:nicotinamidase-related amidase